MGNKTMASVRKHVMAANHSFLNSAAPVRTTIRTRHNTIAATCHAAMLDTYLWDTTDAQHMTVIAATEYAKRVINIPQ